jgi:uncharacterized repeat protein (TIGR01451 family)
MNSVRKKLKILALAGLALGLTAAALPAGATGTAAGTTINNKAVVSYSVGGVAQTTINSAPGAGNSTPGGPGADTVFVVDRLVNFTLTTVDTTAVTGAPGQTQLVTTFLVTNTGNGTEGFQMSAANLVGGTVFGNTDNVDVTAATIKVYYGPDASTAYNAGTAALGNPDNMLADVGRRVFVLSDLPLTARNGDFANVRLTAKAAVAGTAGGTVETATAAGDTAGSVDVVISAAVSTTTSGVTTSVRTSDSGYSVVAASLTVAKTEAVISDPVNGTTAPKAIPGATVEYTLTITNSGAVAATGVSFLDTIASQLTLAQNTFNTNENVSITANGTTRFCTAESGADSNADGCSFSSSQISVNPTTPITIPTGVNNTAVIKYRVTIN